MIFVAMMPIKHAITLLAFNFFFLLFGFRPAEFRPVRRRRFLFRCGGLSLAGAVEVDDIRHGSDPKRLAGFLAKLLFQLL